MQRMTILLCLLLGCAANGRHSTAKGTPSWDGEVQVYGALRAMFHQGQTGTMVALNSMLPNPSLYAVGALTDLAGEVTVIGGTAYLSYPESADSTRTETAAASSAGATLLVVAEVPSWRSVTTQNPIRFEELDASMRALATAAGMSLDARFPFLLEGDFEDLQWHVIDGKRLKAGETSHQDHLAAAVTRRLHRTSATLLGFYSERDERVFTHAGSRTHIHCMIGEPLASGHVDHVVIPAGTTVKFPEGSRR